MMEKTSGMLKNAGIRAALMEWLVVQVASTLEMPSDAVDVGRNLEDYGLDSMQAVGLTGDLQSWLGIEIPPTAIWDNTTIESTCEFLMQLIATGQSAKDGTVSDAKRSA
jgi:acyl carrier protein